MYLVDDFLCNLVKVLYKLLSFFDSEFFIVVEIFLMFWLIFILVCVILLSVVVDLLFRFWYLKSFFFSCGMFLSL